MQSYRKKLDAARLIGKLGIPLTLNVVIHRLNIAEVPELISIALDLGAQRLELANTQFYRGGRDRKALMPTREQYDRAAEIACAASRNIVAPSRSHSYKMITSRASPSPAWADGAAATCASIRPAK